MWLVELTVKISDYFGCPGHSSLPIQIPICQNGFSIWFVLLRPRERFRKYLFWLQWVLLGIGVRYIRRLCGFVEPMYFLCRHTPDRLAAFRESVLPKNLRPSSFHAVKRNVVFSGNKPRETYIILRWISDNITGPLLFVSFIRFDSSFTHCSHWSKLITWYSRWQNYKLTIKYTKGSHKIPIIWLLGISYWRFPQMM